MNPAEPTPAECPDCAHPKAAVTVTACREVSPRQPVPDRPNYSYWTETRRVVCGACGANGDRTRRVQRRRGDGVRA